MTHHKIEPLRTCRTFLNVCCRVYKRQSFCLEGSFAPCTGSCERDVDEPPCAKVWSELTPCFTFWGDINDLRFHLRHVFGLSDPGVYESYFWGMSVVPGGGDATITVFTLSPGSEALPAAALDLKFDLITDTVTLGIWTQ